MTERPLRTDAPLQIQKPCPKTWSELAGDEKKRFCSTCCLHVHNAAELTRMEALTLAADTGARVCMLFQLDPDGAPVFRDSMPVAHVQERPRPLAQLSRWALSAAAGLLAACHGSSTTASGTGANDGQTSKMGQVQSTELLGGVALPQPQPPERMGEATVRIEPAPTPVPPTPDDK